jgi:signal transduction histidine kinase
MKQDHRQLTIQVRDEGTGFDLPTAMSTRQSTQFGGLFSIRERMHALGGAFDIQPAKRTRDHGNTHFPLAGVREGSLDKREHSRYGTSREGCGHSC